MLDVPVYRRLTDAPAVDAWLFTELRDPAEMLRDLYREAGTNRVLVPSILGLRPVGPD